MRLITLNTFGLDGLQTAKAEPVEPGPGQVRIRLLAASLNYHDLATVLGFANPRLKLPIVPISDGAGVIDAIGPEVSGLTAGTLVTTRFFPRWEAGAPTYERLRYVTGETLAGVMQDYLTLPASDVQPAPAHLNAQEAATLPCAALTAWRAIVVEGQVKAGDRVLLQGTGGVSLFALQFARMLGAEIIITSSSDEKLERARALGAHHTINYRQEPQWGKAARKLTGGEGVDLVVEVGGAGTLPESLNALKIGGHLSLIGVLTGIANTVPTARIMAMNATIRGITVGSRDHFDAMNRAIAFNRIHPVIGQTLPFEALRQGLELMQSGQHFGKIGLEFV
jgi:NADPH:quinone reductase-like Zn-dependent oxidoreductase